MSEIKVIHINSMLELELAKKEMQAKKIELENAIQNDWKMIQESLTLSNLIYQTVDSFLKKKTTTNTISSLLLKRLIIPKIKEIKEISRKGIRVIKHFL